MAVALLALGCGPVEYLNQVTRKASQAVAEARKVDAEKWAPYEYWGALEYLTKAREEAGYADYQAAIRLGKKAEQLAREAKVLAMERSAAGPEGAEPVMWQNAPTTEPPPMLPPTQPPPGGGP